MGFTRFQYSKSWRSAEDFPTYEDDEGKVRDDMQSLFDEARDAVNRLIGELKAENLPFAKSAALNAENVQSAIGLLQTRLQELAQNPLADGAVTTAKLADKAVTAAKLADGILSGKADLDGGKVKPEQLARSRVNVSASRTLALTDAGKALYCTNSAAVTLTVPANASVALPVGTELIVYRAGTGTVNIAAASGVTLMHPGAAAAITSRYGSVRLKKWDTNVWGLEGEGLAPAGYLANFSAGLAPAGVIRLTQGVHYFSSESELPAAGTAGRVFLVAAE